MSSEGLAKESPIPSPLSSALAEESRSEEVQSSSPHQPAQVADDVAIRVQNLSKCYHIYDKPHDRLKQSIYPYLQRLAGKQPKQYFREFWALKNVSFEIKKGETVGIIGRNGSGKSTLLQLICGTLSATSGTIETEGRIAALLELGSGFNPEFTGRENVYMNAAVLGLSKKETDARFDQIAAFADIGEFIEQPVKTYSSGMFVRLAFSVQVSIDPEILVVDEALAVGDAYFVHRCMLRLHELKAQGVTIIFVSHASQTVAQLCDRAIWIGEGQIRRDGPAPSVVEEYLNSIFGLHGAASVARVKAAANDEEKRMATFETSMPNIDKRIGSQEVGVIGIGIYDLAGRRVVCVNHGSSVVLRITVKNNSCSYPDRLVVGYIFRNSRGENIASTNTLIEDAAVPPVAIGAMYTVSIRICLPLLCPDNYAFSPSVGYVNLLGEPVVTDRVENAILLKITAIKIVPAIMRFASSFVSDEAQG
ncbi:MAG: ABC transporter ATP-binding protein [Nitrospira sp.]|nr:ABC transporter ATP-binding protein [Nitrospira sp.]